MSEKEKEEYNAWVDSETLKLEKFMENHLPTGRFPTENEFNAMSKEQQEDVKETMDIVYTRSKMLTYWVDDNDDDDDHENNVKKESKNEKTTVVNDKITLIYGDIAKKKLRLDSSPTLSQPDHSMEKKVEAATNNGVVTVLSKHEGGGMPYGSKSSIRPPTAQELSSRRLLEVRWLKAVGLFGKRVANDCPLIRVKPSCHEKKIIFTDGAWHSPIEVDREKQDIVKLPGKIPEITKKAVDDSDCCGYVVVGYRSEPSDLAKGMKIRGVPYDIASSTFSVTESFMSDPNVDYGNRNVLDVTRPFYRISECKIIIPYCTHNASNVQLSIIPDIRKFPVYNLCFMYPQDVAFVDYGVTLSP
jgi:hypothetical protein